MVSLLEFWGPGQRIISGGPLNGIEGEEIKERVLEKSLKYIRCFAMNLFVLRDLLNRPIPLKR